VKVEFYVIDKLGTDDPNPPETAYDVEFNFESESLRHNLK